ncbi:MAG: DUF3373 domain-containing protein [Geobacter sp.]|nr:DUF3373 domain-containing protein [Geobacter sp.]
MKRTTKKLAATIMTAALLAPVSAFAADDVQQKIDALQKELETLKQQIKTNEKKVEKVEEKSLGRWLTIGGDYRFRVDSLRGKVAPHTPFILPAGPFGSPTNGYAVHNDSLMTNRFGLNLKAKATKDVTVTARLLMYKTNGNQTADATNASYFADRNSILDGSIGHVPQDNTLRVDQVFATWSNIADQPIWFSVGRRPSTAGSPTHVRQNNERPGNGGVPGLLVDYAFDGMTLGYAPDIEALPGSYAKLCYGRGFEAGYRSGNSIRDTDMLGVAIVPIDTDPLRIDFQWNRGFNIFDNPNNVQAELGDIDWYGLGALSTLKNVGMGNLNLFASTGMSVTHPNGNVSPGTVFGLLTGDFNTGAEAPTDKTGYSVYVGARYDLPSTGTKLGLEYNYGSKNWIPFDPAADDMWTSKLGTRGHVYETYLIQELKLQPISSYLSKAFFRLGYQYYDFEYTNSNNWVGAPTKISDLTATNMQYLPPLKSAQDIYATFEVKF